MVRVDAASPEKSGEAAAGNDIVLVGVDLELQASSTLECIKGDDSRTFATGSSRVGARWNQTAQLRIVKGAYPLRRTVSITTASEDTHLGHDIGGGADGEM